MQLSDIIFSNLRIRGHKLTTGRKCIIKILAYGESPVSVTELLESLQQENISLNKTTVYRELEFLRQQKIVREIQFGERNKRYEITIADHHHHLVCKKCKQVEEIVSEGLESNLSLMEKEIFRQKKFQEIYHSLEFFGLCRKCQ